MIKCVSILTTIVAVSGCMSSQDACDGYGFERGTTAYAQCLMESDARRQAYWQNVSKSLNSMTINGQQQNHASSGLLRSLRGQWMQNGNRMCRYSDGTVMNIGVGVCPISI